MPLRRLALAALAAAVCLAQADTAAAQRGGRFGGTPLYENEGFRQEVDLTPEQVEKLREIEEQNRVDFRGEEIRERFEEAKTDEERNKIREELQAKFQESREKIEAGRSEVLDDKQKARYEQLQLRQRGVSAFADDDERAKELGLSDAQREEMRAVRDRAVQEIRESGDFSRFRDPEWREKIQGEMLAKLTPEQKQKYDAKVGPEPTYDLRGGGGDGPRGGGGGMDSASGQGIQSFRGFGEAAGEGEFRASIAARPRTVPVDQEVAEVDPYDALLGPEEEEDDAAEPSVRREPPAEVAAAGEEVMSFDFAGAPWDAVLREFANFAGLTLDPGPVPPGGFTYYDGNEYTATEALDVLNGYLLLRGYVLVRRDSFLVCANIEENIPPNLVPDVPLTDLPDRGENELVRVVIPLERGEAREAVAEVAPLLGPQGQADALTATNSVVVRDTGGNVRRIVDLLDGLGGQSLFKQIPLKHLDAYDAALTVRTQLGIQPNADDDRRRRGREEEEELSVTADDRTNMLLVTAPADKMRLVEEILEAVDVDRDADGNVLERGSSRPVFRSFPLAKADSDDVEQTVNALFPGTVVNESSRGKSIQINAPPAQLAKIAELIEQMDAAGQAETISTVIPLARMDPLSAALTISNMFRAEEEGAPVVEPDSLGRRLLVRGTPEQITEIKALLGQLGEDGTGARTEAGTLRTLSLGGRDPERMIPLLRQLWDTRDTQPIRVVTPSAPPAIERRGTVSGLRTPPPPADAAAENESPDERPATTFLDPFRLLGQPAFAVQDDLAEEPAGAEPTADAALDFLLGDEPALPETPAAAPPAAAAPTSDPDAPVTMTVLDGQLVLYSQNQAKLDELEELVSRLGSVIPPDDSWTVMYLRNADATVTSETLEKLLPSASVSGGATDGTMLGSMASGLSGFGGSLMDVAGVSNFGATALQIVVDVPHNALWVQGPPAEVRQVEQLVAELDGDSRPDNLRDRVPRTIEVEYADVTEVADIVREVFKEKTADGLGAMAGMFGGGRGGRGGGNPLAMLMGGGGGGEGGDSPQVELSIGVDTRTSRLIVSAPQALFEQVEALVNDLDRAAKDAERGVRFFTLRDADAGSVTGALSSMMPRVSTGGGSVVRSPRTTGDSSSSSSSSPSRGSSGGSDDGGDGGARDAMRAMMFQQMMQGRGGGGGRFGGGRDAGGDAGGGPPAGIGGGGRGGRTRGGR